MGRIAVVELSGLLADGVEELDHAVRLALAENPRGVVCDLSGVLESDTLGGLALLASFGGLVRHWPAIPGAVVCPDARVREAVRTQPLGEHLMATGSVRAACSAVLATPAPAEMSLRLAPHPTAARAGRDFVTRALLDWRRAKGIPSACIAVSELVTNAVVHAGTDIELSIAAAMDTIRVTVRDRSAAKPVRRVPHLAVHGRGVGIVADISRAWGVLPTVDGGKVVWAVLDAPQTCATQGAGASVCRVGPVMFGDVRVELSGAMTAHLYDDLAGAVTVDFIADVVNAVLDEFEITAQPLAPETLMLEARCRLERFAAARSRRPQ